MASICKAAVIAAALACFAAGSARAADDDDKDCDALMEELKSLSESLMSAADPKGVGPVCAATGQLLGVLKASREVASECYDEGIKRDQMLISFDRAVAETESKIGQVCK